MPATEIRNCTLVYDDRTGNLTVYDRHGAQLLQLKLPHGGDGTMRRVRPGYDSDNYWLGVKPADCCVTEKWKFPFIWDEGQNPKYLTKT